MAIFRGVGGSGDSSDNSFLQEVTAQANAASASAFSAANSASAILNLTAATGAAGTDASYNASTGVLTIPRGDAGVDAVVDTASVSSAGAVMDSDFNTNGFMKRTGSGSYTVDTNTYLTSHQDISGKANLTGANFTGGVSVNGGNLSIGTLVANQDVNVFGNITVSGTVDGVDIASLGNTVAGKADLAGDTFTGTITAPNVDISTTGTVTTNIATGTGGLGNTKTLNLGTGYGGSLVGLTTVNIGSQSTTCQNTVNIGSGVSVTNREDTINLKGNVTVDGTTNIVTEYPFYNNLSHGQGGTQVLTTTLTTIGTAFDTPSGIGSKHIDFSLDMIYYNVNYTNDGELKVCVETPSPSSETTINLGTVQSTSNPTSYMKEWQVTGNFVKHFSLYCGLSKNNSSGGTSMGLIYNYRYDVSTNRTIVTTGLYTNSPSVGDTVYLHPFDWEAQGTTVEGNSYKLDGTTDNTMEMRRDFTQNLGYFTSSISVSVKAKKITASGTHVDNIHIDTIQGKTVKIRN